MSLASMKLKTNLATTAATAANVALEVMAVHHHPDSRELSVHLRIVEAPEEGTVDLVLLGDDMEAALAAGLKVGDRVTLSLDITPVETV
jgi:hypothetical protein